MTFIPGSQARRTVFGEDMVADYRITSKMLFDTRIDTSEVEIFANNAGSVALASAEPLLEIQTGASASSLGKAVGRRLTLSAVGQLMMFRAAGFFSAGVAGSEQLLGQGDDEGGFFFGYNGANFGIFIRRGAEREVRTLTITTPSSTAENITITLNGNADGSVAVTASSDATVTANEIAAHDFSDLGDGWAATAVGDTVIFTSYVTGAKSGSYSISGTTADGTFAQTVAGANPTTNFIQQSSWNRDKADGSGQLPSLDSTMGNFYEIQLGWSAFDSVRFSVMHPDGDWVVVHVLEQPNSSVTPHTTRAASPIFAKAQNIANTSNIKISLACAVSGVMGPKSLLGSSFGANGSVTGIDTTEVAILSIRNPEIIGGKRNHVLTTLKLLSVACDGAKPVVFRLYRNPTLVGASWAAVDGNSVAQKDTSATSFSDGTLLFSVATSPDGSETVPLDEAAGDAEPGEVLTVTAQTFGGWGADCEASLNWQELS